MQQLIRWGRQVLPPFVSSGAAAGTPLRSTCGRPTATGSSSATAATTLASAVHIQEDRGKSISRARRGGQTARSTVGQARQEGSYNRHFACRDDILSPRKSASFNPMQGETDMPFYEKGDV